MLILRTQIQDKIYKKLLGTTNPQSYGTFGRVILNNNSFPLLFSSGSKVSDGSKVSVLNVTGQSATFTLSPGNVTASWSHLAQMGVDSLEIRMPGLKRSAKCTPESPSTKQTQYMKDNNIRSEDADRVRVQVTHSGQHTFVDAKGNLHVYSTITRVTTTTWDFTKNFTTSGGTVSFARFIPSDSSAGRKRSLLAADGGCDPTDLMTWGKRESAFALVSPYTAWTLNWGGKYDNPCADFSAVTSIVLQFGGYAAAAN